MKSINLTEEETRILAEVLRNAGYNFYQSSYNTWDDKDFSAQRVSQRFADKALTCDDILTKLES